MDYFNHVGIESRIDTATTPATIFLRNPDDVESAQKILEEFLRDPGQEKFLLASWQTGDSTLKVEGNSSAGTSLLKSMFSRVGGLTVFVALFCVVVFIAQNGAGDSSSLLNLGFPLTASSLLSGQELWRLITPMFLHFTLAHIAFNLMWWWVFAGDIEKKQSALHLLLVTLIVALCSNVAQFIVTGPNFGGLSGVVYGLLGYCWILGRRSPHLGITVQASTMRFMVLWLVLCYTDVVSEIVGPIANAAHTVGLVAGVLCGVTVSFFGKSDHSE